MSSNIAIQRICQLCSNEFTARTTVTRFCSHKCSSKASKLRAKELKITKSNIETNQIRIQPLEVLKQKEFLTVPEVAQLLNCSVRTAYLYIGNGTISAVNFGTRLIRVKRSEIDKFFVAPEPTQDLPVSKIEHRDYDISECYLTEEVREKFGISESGLRGLILKHQVPKFRKGWYAYVPKIIIDNLLS